MKYIMVFSILLFSTVSVAELKSEDLGNSSVTPDQLKNLGLQVPSGNFSEADISKAMQTLKNAQKVFDQRNKQLEQLMSEK